MEKQNDLVSLNIGKEVIGPILEKHLKQAMVEALGGTDLIIQKAMDVVLKKKVNSKGEVDRYDSDNKYTFVEVVLNNAIEAAVRKELGDVISQSSLKIKNALIARLKTDKGASQVADALIEGMEGTFKSNWMSRIDIKFSPYSRE